jgi:hypothetical protein
MNREMVMASKGRPPKKIREREGSRIRRGVDLRRAAADVDFVRLVGDEVVRL